MNGFNVVYQQLMAMYDSGSPNPGRIKIKTGKKLASVASVVSVHHLRPRAGLVGPGVSLK